MHLMLIFETLKVSLNKNYTNNFVYDFFVVICIACNMNPPVRFHLTSALSGITISFLPPTCGPISNAGGWESDRAIAATKTVPRLRVPALVPWKLRGFQPSILCNINPAEATFMIFFNDFTMSEKNGKFSDMIF
jgi:hypothetical protein